MKTLLQSFALPASNPPGIANVSHSQTLATASAGKPDSATGFRCRKHSINFITSLRKYYPILQVCLALLFLSTSVNAQSWLLSDTYASTNSHRRTVVNADGPNNTYITGSDTASAAVFAAPLVLSATQSQVNASCSAVCNGSATVVVSGGIPPYTYSWSPSGGSGATASSLCAGNYTVTIMDDDIELITKSFTITALGVATPTPSSNSPVCTGNTINLSTPAVAGATYSWTGPSSFTSSVQNPSRTGATVAMAGTYSVTVTVGGCTSAAGTTAVVVNTTPATPSASSNTPVCTGNTINLSTPAVAGATYSWTGPSSFSSSVQNPSRTGATVAMAGTYSITVTTTGCTSGVGTTAVVVNATPATPTASSNTPVCTGNTINLSTPAVAGATYSWTGPSSFSSSVQNPSRTGATVAMAGTYSISVTTTGCTSGVGTTAVVVNTTPATPTASSNTPVCTGNTINLSTPAVAGATYSWTGPSSFSSSVQNPSRTGATVAMAGTYSITVTTTGCTSGVGTTAVVVNATPATPTASSNTPVCTGNTINLSTPAVAGATYSWTGPSSFSSSVQNPSRTGATVAMAGTYSITVTTTGCTSGVGTTAVVVNNTPTTPTASSNSPVCISNTINLSTPAVAGATYSWTGPSSFSSSVQNPSRTGTTEAMAGTYSITVTTTGCTSGVGTVNMVVPSVINTTTVSQTNASCNGGANGSATVTPSGGMPGYTYSWSPSGGAAATASDLTAGAYTVTVTDAAGCTATASFTITEPAYTPGSNSYTLPTTNQTIVSNAGSNYVTGSCELVSSVQPSGSNAVSGSVTSKIWIEGAVPTQSGLPFVERHYEITPASNASTVTGTITLYFTQTEFDNFNSHAGSLLDLPASTGDNAGKANLRIGKYSGISGDSTGLPASYNSTSMVIDPDDNDIVWNAVSSAWEITFAVDGFSGFIVQTAMTTLPVSWISFTVKKQGQSVLLNWSTAAEQNTKDFSVQHSVDGINWNTVTTFPAAGNSNSVRNYSFVHTGPAKEDNYYRIMQTDLDRKFSYSEVRVISLSGDNAAFTIIGNRVTNGTLQLQVHHRSIISLYEANGKLLWTKQFTSGLQTIDVSRYAKGVYLLNAEGKAQKILIQ